MASVNQLASVLDSGPTGRLVLFNFVDSVSNGALRKDLAASFITTWAGMCSGVTDLEGALQKLRVVRESKIDFVDQTSHPVEPGGPYLYTVLRYEEIYRRFHDDTLSSTLSGVHTEAVKFGRMADETARKVSEERILALQDVQTSAGYYSVELKSRETIKGLGNGKLIWVSTAPPGIKLNEPDCFGSTAPREADIARDNLGLAHYGLWRGRRDYPLLVALRLETSEVLGAAAGDGPWRPTAIDAEAHSRFRGAYGDLRRRAQKWGRAVHLESLSDRTGNLGAVEAVSSNFRPTRAAMTFLGYPRIPRDDVLGEKDDKFALEIGRRRKLSWAQEKFVEICI